MLEPHHELNAKNPIGLNHSPTSVMRWLVGIHSALLAAGSERRWHRGVPTTPLHARPGNGSRTVTLTARWETTAPPPSKFQEPDSMPRWRPRDGLQKQLPLSCRRKQTRREKNKNRSQVCTVADAATSGLVSALLMLPSMQREEKPKLIPGI